MNSQVGRRGGEVHPAGGVLNALRDALWNAICACVISYCVVSFIAGQAGLLAYKDLKDTMIVMQQRSAQLQEENGRLAETKASLENDADRMAIEARDIGYVRENEKMVLLKTTASGNADAGRETEMTRDLEPIRAGYSSGLPDSMIKILSGLIGIMVLLVSFISELLQTRQHQMEIRSRADQP
ncbi:MAG: septum formation initiator family protein [Spirochaetaceae bacterium]|nr:septum formation initiator family protein [Spirochaetaceae bacterium]